MKTLNALLVLCIFAAALCNGNSIPNQLKLPPAEIPANITFKDTLMQRRTSRTFSDKPLSAKEISNLLWVAYGSNRPNGKRTIAAARAQYAISMYVLTAKGCYRHNRKDNTLTLVNKNDARRFAEGRGTMGPAAGAVFVLVADMNTFATIPQDKQMLFIGYEVGSICQDMYLYCAGVNLNTVCCGSHNEKALALELGLAPNEKAVMTMVVGHP